MVKGLGAGMDDDFPGPALWGPVLPTPSIPHPSNDILTPALHFTTLSPAPDWEVTKMPAACRVSATVFILGSGRAL